MGLYEERGYTLQQAIDSGLMELDSWYGGAVLDVFDCNVLGTPYRYVCDEAAQLRMINGRIANVSVILMCGQIIEGFDGDPVYAFLSHTSTECGKVHTAYLNFTNAITERNATIKSNILAATTVQQVDVLVASILVRI